MFIDFKPECLAEREKSRNEKDKGAGSTSVASRGDDSVPITSNAPRRISRRSSSGGGVEQIKSYQLLVPLFITIVFAGFLVLSFGPSSF